MLCACLLFSGHAFDLIWVWPRLSLSLVWHCSWHFGWFGVDLAMFRSGLGLVWLLIWSRPGCVCSALCLAFFGVWFGHAPVLAMSLGFAMVSNILGMLMFLDLLRLWSCVGGTLGLAMLFFSGSVLGLRGAWLWLALALLLSALGLALFWI